MPSSLDDVAVGRGPQAFSYKSEMGIATALLIRLICSHLLAVEERLHLLY